MGWDEDDLQDDDLNAAIMASLLGPGSNNPGSANQEEEKMLKEIIKLSELDYMKNQGGISLDHIKRKKKPQASSKMETPVSGSTI